MFSCSNILYLSYSDIQYSIPLKINYQYFHLLSSKQEYQIPFPHFVAWGPLRKLDFSASAIALETVSIVSMETILLPNNLTINQERWSEDCICNTHTHTYNTNTDTHQLSEPGTKGAFSLALLYQITSWWVMWKIGLILYRGLIYLSTSKHALVLLYGHHSNIFQPC